MSIITKDFTIPVPDELYLAPISGNKTLTATYNGIRYLDLIIDKQLDIVIDHIKLDDSLKLAPINPNIEIIRIDLDQYPEIGYFLFVPKDSSSYIFEDETLSDGTVFNKIVNPQLHDYFYQIKYNRQNASWKLEPIVKDTKTPGLQKAISLITQIDGLFALDTAPDSIRRLTELESQYLNAYKTELETYIEQEQTKIVWKYTTFSSAPAIPNNLLALLGEGN
jgi:hypothetical protein